jgi:hypothetical protein
MTKADPMGEFDPFRYGYVPVDASREHAAARFLDANHAVGRFVVGHNAQSEFLHRHVPLSGLIDDRAPADSFWNGLPVIHMNQVPRNAWVVNASTSIAPRSLGSSRSISSPRAPERCVLR